MAKYKIYPMFGTQYYGSSKDAPPEWYITSARDKQDAVRNFSKRYKVTQEWVKMSPIVKLGRLI